MADQPHQVEEFKAWVDEAAEWGEELVFMDRAAIREEVHSPLWQAGLFRPPEQGRDAMVDPAKLVRGLARVALGRGVAIHEGSRVTAVERRAGGVVVRTAAGGVGPGGPRRRRDVGVLRAGCAAWVRTSCRSTTTRSCRNR